MEAGTLTFPALTTALESVEDPVEPLPATASHTVYASLVLDTGGAEVNSALSSEIQTLFAQAAQVAQASWLRGIFKLKQARSPRYRSRFLKVK